MGKTFTTIGEVEEVVATMRRLGISRLRLEGLELDLGDEPAPRELAPAKAESKEAKRGKDGLTAAEQAELYGTIMDAEG